MNTLWTPWRMDHVTGKIAKVEGCLFEPTGNCKSDKKLLLLYRNKSVVVLLNRFPYSNGHLLIAPKKHVSCISELSFDDNALLTDMVKSATKILKAQLNPDGFNIGLNIGSEAGAGIANHLHYHIVPRWRGDHNFMTVLAEVRTIPEHIESTFETLVPHFSKL